MSAFAASRQPDEAYNDAVYTAGADELIRARDAAGHSAFDAALRTYLDWNANRVASPADFATAFGGLPSVIQTLKRNSMIA